MKKAVIIPIIILFINCQQNISNQSIQGTWAPYKDSKEFLDLPWLSFKNDSVYINDPYTYIIKAKYHLHGGSITYFLERDTLDLPISFNLTDSLLTVNHIKYDFLFDSEENYSHHYNLIGINTKSKTHTTTLQSFDYGFHIFKNKNGVTQVKLNDRITSNLEEIRDFIFSGCSENKKDILNVVIYVGKGIQLTDLLNCYIIIGTGNILKITLITDYNLRENSYATWDDGFHLWEEQYINYNISKNNPSFPKPPESDSNNRKTYLASQKVMIIPINSYLDIQQLNFETINSPTLLQLSCSLSLSDYFKIKMAIPKNKILRTEFNYLL